jgi:hypothetical protein
MPSKGNTTARGYGHNHQQLRKWWRPRVDAGLVDCWRCGQPIQPGQPWDLGHDDHDRTQYHGPEHRGRQCPAGANRATYGRKTTEPRRWRL